MPDDDSTRGLTIRQLVLEMREDIRKLFGAINHLENNVVTQDELQMWRQAQRTTKRWAIATIISLAVLGVTILGIVLGTID